jgi:flagellin
MQVAEGTYASVSDGLQRMHDLLVQYANIDSSDSTAKTASSDEWSNLRTALGTMITSAKWGDKPILANGFNVSFQVGANAGDTIVADQLANISADTIAKSSAILGPVSLAIDATINYEDWGGSGTADMLTAIATASDVFAWARGWFGAMQNRLESTLQNLQTTTENLSASESRIRDTDMASEMVNFTRHQILMQAGTAMLAQANQLPRSSLRLLQ